jgi:LPXTG-site transpeptidase (sortase) family protein
VKGISKLYISALVLILFGAIGTFAYTFIHASISAPEKEVPVVVEPSFYTSSSTPLQLIIPKIGVNAAVQDVGISRKGRMGVPSNYTDVGWYRYGAIPGNKGNAVFDGHLDNGFGRDGVFKHLSELIVGDQIIIKLKDGTERTFVITEAHLLEQHTTETQDIFQREGPPHIILITCEGDWDSSTKTYAERRVITGELQS